MANLPGRLGGWEGLPFGGGYSHFCFRCKDTDEFNRALKIFAAIRAAGLELVLHDGPGTDLAIIKTRRAAGSPRRSPATPAVL
ncbi:MAG TPA: hypothetical protein PKY77_18210 [Phycisphaerae bacterium]|nr:hypothetical protein [Phycisphaerae bacterium]HRY70176.1 hypothetical protein [Phycisphaerae bacterium]HSA27391.1 hypothetical protein [Phycisphaerae bacterium]